MKNLLFLLIIILFSCQTSTKKKDKPSTVDWEKLESELDSLFTQEFPDDEPGVAVLVAYDDKKLYAKGFGVRDLKSQKPITPSTNMEIASASKQFTALAILHLVDQGKISLKDTVYQFLPYPSFKNVTIEQLINHTSGLADAEAYFYDHWDADKIASNKDIIDWYKQTNRKVNEPGKNFKYSDGTYEILPVIVEKISGKDYADFMKENIFSKAGMKHSVAYNLNEPVNIEDRAYYYQKDSLGNWKKMDGHPLTGLFGAGGIYTSLNDYFEFDTALRKQTIFSDSIHELIFKPSSTTVENGEEKKYAMGWYVNDSLAEHYGGWYGVNSLTRRYLNQPLTLAFFANRDDFFEKGNLIAKTDAIVKSYIEKSEE